MARLEIDRAEPDKVESMPRNNPAGKANRHAEHRFYFFDMKDRVPTRDRTGLEFSTAAGTIDHSKELARLLRRDSRIKDPDLSIIVADESGTEVHRELVNPDASRLGVSLDPAG
jgi:hypothetical protein